MEDTWNIQGIYHRPRIHIHTDHVIVEHTHNTHAYTLRQIPITLLCQCTRSLSTICMSVSSTITWSVYACVLLCVHRFDARLRESREGKTPKQRKFKRENKNRLCFAVHARERGKPVHTEFD